MKIITNNNELEAWVKVHREHIMYAIRLPDKVIICPHKFQLTRLAKKHPTAAHGVITEYNYHWYEF